MPITRLIDIIPHQLANFPQPVAIATKENGEWRNYSTQEMQETFNALSLGLMELGIGPGDKVGIASGNRSEWILMDQAILQLGAVTVPIYPTCSSDDYKYIADHASIKICFVANEELYGKAKSAFAPNDLYTFEKVNGAQQWTDVSAKADQSRIPELKALRDKVNSDQLATLIYTSGTTGRPKGVMLTHDNLVSNVNSSRTCFPVGEYAKAISFLPLSHSYERMLTYLYMATGVSIYFQESLEDLGDRIREVKPTVFTAVPRLLEKIFDKIMDKGEALTGIKRKLFYWAVDLGLEYDVNGKGPWYHMQLSLARKLIFSKWQEALGGNVEVIASGSAALQPRLARVFNAAGIKLMEGYGLTETSPVVSVNVEENGGLRFGTVGRPIPDVTVMIAEDGEILVKGPNVMKGYYNDPEKTAEVIDPNGWFHTGDIGELDADGFLRITDRKKEIFKTSGGKYIAPQVMENRLKESRFIEQVMVIGENEKFPSALVVPNFEFLEEYCERKGIPYSGPAQICAEKRIVDRINKEVNERNAGLGNWEQIKKIALVADVWTIDGGQLTPTMKLKRKVIMAHCQAAVSWIYG